MDTWEGCLALGNMSIKARSVLNIRNQISGLRNGNERRNENAEVCPPSRKMWATEESVKEGWGTIKGLESRLEVRIS